MGIPDDALGIMAVSNNYPTEFVASTERTQLFGISGRSANSIVLSQLITSSHAVKTYLGAIVSADRRTVYWVNDTRPLP